MCESLLLNNKLSFIEFPSCISWFNLKEYILIYIQVQNINFLYLKTIHKYPSEKDIPIYMISYNLDFQHNLHFKNHHFQWHSSQKDIIKLPAHLWYDQHVSSRQRFLYTEPLLHNTFFLFYYTLCILSRNYQFQ